MNNAMTQAIYGGLIVALLSGSGGLAYYLTAGQGAPVAVAVQGDLCRTDQPLAAHRIMVIDTSDRLTENERDLVRHALDADAADAEPYEKMSVLALDAAHPYEPPALFSACAPKKAKDAKGVSENPNLYAAIWKHKFAAPLDKSVEEAMPSSPQNSSPLIETIWAISRRSDFGADLAHRRLDIVSDMLQHSTDYSQYHAGYSYAGYIQSRFGKLHSADLKGVQVVIHYLIRPGTLALQTPAHVRFWRDFFRQAGATVEVVGEPAQPAGVLQ